MIFRQPRSQFPRLLLAARGENLFSQAGVPPFKRPFGFPVADEIDSNVHDYTFSIRTPKATTGALPKCDLQGHCAFALYVRQKRFLSNPIVGTVAGRIDVWTARAGGASLTSSCGSWEI